MRVRNHAKMVDCYLTTFKNNKGYFGDKKKIAQDIIGIVRKGKHSPVQNGTVFVLYGTLQYNTVQCAIKCIANHSLYSTVQ